MQFPRKRRVASGAEPMDPFRERGQRSPTMMKVYPGKHAKVTMNPAPLHVRTILSKRVQLPISRNPFFKERSQVHSHLCYDVDHHRCELHSNDERTNKSARPVELNLTPNRTTAT